MIVVTLLTSHRTGFWWRRWHHGPAARTADCGQSPGTAGPVVAEHPLLEAGASCGPPAGTVGPPLTLPPLAMA